MSGQETATLPGGWRSGRGIEKRVTFRRIDGYVEEAMLGISSETASAPALVSKLLAAHVERIGDCRFGEAEAAQLCVADRQWLILQLARRMHGDHRWLQSACSGCSAAIDIPLDLSALPVKFSGDGFPETTIELGHKRWTLRSPTGADQQHIAAMKSDEEALRALLLRCVVAVDGAAPPDELFTLLADAECAAIEQALEDASPAIVTLLSVTCPECGHQQQVQMDPMELCQGSAENLLHEIHVLASQYHWSEQEILSLPRERRRSYLQMIDRNRGMIS